MGTVAGAEPAAEVTGFTNGDTAKVSADTKHDQPLRLLDTVLIGLRITESLPVNLLSLLNFVLSTVTDENGLSTPLDNDVLALGDRIETDFNLGLSQDIGGGGHVHEEVLNSSLGTNSRSETEGSGHEVGENLVRARGLVGSVFAETGNLQGRLVLVGVAERAIEGGGLGGLRQSSPLLAGGDSSAGGGQLLAGASAQQSA